MQLIESLSAVTDSLHGCVLAIGNFDGVHKGHHALINHVQHIAKDRGLLSAILTFEPHPRKLFRPDDPPFRITPAAVKQRRLGKTGIDILYALPFNWDFASQSAEDFVRNVLLNGIKPSLVVVGDDFRFGQLRKGTADTIRDAGIDVEIVNEVSGLDGERYSSTAIRDALLEGDIERANNLLGWDWEIEGEIVRGDRRGHDLGYPTANVLMGETLHPAYGVYATLVQIEGETIWRKAATNIGIRPMFELKVGQVEAHILDYEDKDIYGKKLRIKPVKRLRGEAKFNSLEDLVRQIDEDCRTTRKILP